MSWFEIMVLIYFATAGLFWVRIIWKRRIWEKSLFHMIGLGVGAAIASLAWYPAVVYYMIGAMMKGEEE